MYLGVILDNTFYDDMDIARQLRYKRGGGVSYKFMYVNSNTIVRQFR